MIPETLNGLSYRFAFVFNGQPQMRRDDNLQFYDKLTAQGVDLPTFEQKENQIILQNAGVGGPRNVLRVHVGHFGDKFRLFVLEDYPSKSMEIFLQTADASWRVFREVWKDREQGLALTEVTLRYTAAVKGGDATNFLLNNCLRVPKESLASLKRKLAGVGLRLVSPVEIPNEGATIPLSNADFNVNVETLLEDPSLLYFQLTAKWPSLPLPTARMPKIIKKLPAFLNPECREPSWYLKEAKNFLSDQIVKFIHTAEA